LERAIIQNGGISKTGLGTLSLTALNTYLGDTIVSQGVLSITNPYLADTSNVKLDASSLGGILNLNTGVVDTIQSLYINGVQQVGGIWGGIGSGAPHTSPYITGTGALDVTAGAITAINGVWSATSGVGTMQWADSSNWTPHAYPRVQGDSATFGTGSQATIDLAGATPTVSVLTFNNSGSASYLIKDTGAGSLTLQGAGVSPASVTVTTGSDSISANIVLASDVVFSGSGTLALSGSITGTGPLTMSGAGGKLILSGTGLYNGGTIVNAGILAVTSSTALPDNQSLTVGAGGTLIFDPSYTASSIIATPISAASSAVNPVPEPSTLVLLIAGLAIGLGVQRRRK